MMRVKVGFPRLRPTQPETIGTIQGSRQFDDGSGSGDDGEDSSDGVIVRDDRGSHRG